MLLTFTKPEFEDLIKDGIKKHTIRADKGNRWKVGNSIQFWRGNPRMRLVVGFPITGGALAREGSRSTSVQLLHKVK